MKNCVGITIIKLTKWQGKKSIVNVELIIVEEDCFKPTKSIKSLKQLPKELWQGLKLPCIILSLILQNLQLEILQCCYHEKFLGYKQLTKLIRNKHSSLLQRIVWSWYSHSQKFKFRFPGILRRFVTERDIERNVCNRRQWKKLSELNYWM